MSVPEFCYLAHRTHVLERNRIGTPGSQAYTRVATQLKPDRTVAEIIGDPKQVDAELQAFRRDSKILSSRRARLIEKYPKKWVAIYDGKVQASALSLNSVLASVDKLGLPRESVVVRYVDRNLRRMIL